MRKLLLFLVTSTLLIDFKAISTEKEFEVTNEAAYHLHRPVYSTYYDHLPSHPNVYTTIDTYQTPDLTTPVGQISPNQSMEIVSMMVNDYQQPVFMLANGTYVLASQADIFEDIILTRTMANTSYWLKKDFKVWSSPLGYEAKKIQTKRQAYTQVKITELVSTPRGDFAKIEEGWIHLDELSQTDNRMEKVQQMLLEKHHQNYYGIYVYQLETGRSAGLNENQMMYAASVAKLPVLYYTQLALDQGDVKLDDKLKYTAAVNTFTGHYQPSGSGTLPKSSNDKNYSIDELIRLTSQKSDNISSNILAYYVTSQFNQTYYQTLNPITEQTWDMVSRHASPKMAAQVMTALYQHDPESFVLQTLSQTDFDKERISKNIDVKVAHKIGDAYDFKHDVAVVYTDSPFVIAIFTDKASYDNISDIATDVYEILK